MTCSRRCRRLNHHHHYHREEREREREREGESFFLSFFLSGTRVVHFLSPPHRSLSFVLDHFFFFCPAKKSKNEPTKESTFSLKKFQILSAQKKSALCIHASNRRETTDDGRVVRPLETGGCCIFLFDSSKISRDLRSRRLLSKTIHT